MIYWGLFPGDAGIASQNRDDLPDPVTPAKAGVQCGVGRHIDASFRWHDEVMLTIADIPVIQ